MIKLEKPLKFFLHKMELKVDKRGYPFIKGNGYTRGVGGRKEKEDILNTCNGRMDFRYYIRGKNYFTINIFGTPDELKKLQDIFTYAERLYFEKREKDGRNVRFDGIPLIPNGDVYVRAFILEHLRIPCIYLFNFDCKETTIAFERTLKARARVPIRRATVKARKEAESKKQESELLEPDVDVEETEELELDAENDLELENNEDVEQTEDIEPLEEEPIEEETEKIEPTVNEPEPKKHKVENQIDDPFLIELEDLENL